MSKAASSKSPSKSPSPQVGSSGVAGPSPDPANVLAPDLDLGEEESTYEDDSTIQTSTTSLNSTILNYRKLNGRTYHNFEGAEYWGPNDEAQNIGLDISHHMVYLAFDNKLFRAPLKDPQQVLDLGTGTGTWAVDFADEYPSAQVTGTDISPIQPRWVPPNCTFELDNCEVTPWTFDSDSFDYIHIRGLTGCIQDWPALYSECLRCLKPGGWLEQQEFVLPITKNEGDLPDDSVWHTWGQVFRESGARTGRTFEVADYWEEWLREAGFEGVTFHRDSVQLPIGDWPKEQKYKEVGRFNRASLEQGLDGFATFLCSQVLGWTQDEISVLLAKVRKALKESRALQAYYRLETIYVQKPAV